MPPRPVVAAAIVDSLATPARLLAAARSYPPELAGLFELPGGKVERGENAQAALEREIREELGTILTLGAPVPGPEPEDGSSGTRTPVYEGAATDHSLSTGIQVSRILAGAGAEGRPSHDPGAMSMTSLLHTGPAGAQSGDRAQPDFAPWPILNGRVMWVWLAEIAPGAPEPRRNGSHSELLWVPLEDALDIPWIPTNLPIVVDTLTRIAEGGAVRPT